MKSFNLLLTKNYTRLKITIICIVIFLLLLINLLDFYLFEKNGANIIFDVIASFILTSVILFVTFFLIKMKENQLEDQIKQLCEAYQYIGQINSKIDALLELDFAALNQSDNRPMHENISLIFKKLLSLLQAKSGLLLLFSPRDFKMMVNLEKNFEVKNIIEILGRSGVREFIHSQDKSNEEIFLELGLTQETLKNYNFVIKPIYMNKQDIGVMILLFGKNQVIDDRDLNIIRVFSFYLALNATVNLKNIELPVMT